MTVTFPSSDSFEAIDALRFIGCFVDIEEASRLLPGLLTPGCVVGVTARHLGNRDTALCGAIL